MEKRKFPQIKKFQPLFFMLSLYLAFYIGEKIADVWPHLLWVKKIIIFVCTLAISIVVGSYKRKKQKISDNDHKS